MFFDAHTSEISTKVSEIFKCINKTQDVLSKEARLIVKETLALSLINYGITI